MMTFKTADELVSNVHTVASLPAIFERINTVANRPSAALIDVAGVISEDVGLSTRLLRLVNSAYFGFPSRIESITKACVIVGTRQIRQLALATSVVNVFKSVPPDILNMRLFWRHSVGCAMAARTIGMIGGAQDVESLFVLGLLHDVGRLVMLQAMPDETASVIRDAYKADLLTHDVEAARFGFSHADVGSALLKMWGLPPVVVEAVGRHHRPVDARCHQREVASVHFCDIAVHALGIGESGNPMVPPLDEAAWNVLGLEPATVDAVAAQLEDQLEELSDQFCGDVQ
jgi:HD-like signal output (HDOD) protein